MLFIHVLDARISCIFNTQIFTALLKNQLYYPAVKVAFTN